MEQKKTEGVFIRLAPKDKKLLQKAADADKRRLADWVRIAALEKAEGSDKIAETVSARK